MLQPLAFDTGHSRGRMRQVLKVCVHRVHPTITTQATTHNRTAHPFRSPQCQESDDDALGQSTSVGADARIDALSMDEGAHATCRCGVHGAHTPVATNDAVGRPEGDATETGTPFEDRRPGLEPRR